MQVDLTAQEIEILLESIKYAKPRVEAGGQAYEARNARLAEFDELAVKLRAAKASKQSD